MYTKVTQDFPYIYTSKMFTSGLHDASHKYWHRGTKRIIQKIIVTGKNLQKSVKCFMLSLNLLLVMSKQSGAKEESAGVCAGYYKSLHLRPTSVTLGCPYPSCKTTEQNLRQDWKFLNRLRFPAQPL